MDKNAIKKYAVWARRELIERVSQRAMIYGITAKDAGDPNAESVNGHLLSQAEKRQRQALIRNIKTKGYEQVMEEVAYTWFNRFAALRFMEVNGYLPSHIRVFTNDAGEFKPQILAEAIHLEIDGLDMNKVYELESANKSEELFKYLLIVQCNALNSILPGMFQRIEDYTELLLPDYLLREGSVIEQMVTTIPEEDWNNQVQIIGWLYQFYIAEPKDELINARKRYKDADIPFVTQLFTTDWIVKFMVENSLGRMWKEGHPESVIDSKWRFYLQSDESDPLVAAELDTIKSTYASISPEQIRCIDPCSGSGHICAYMFDVLVQIYEDYGFSAREAAGKIVKNNLFAMDIDERAAQLTYFSIMMKARQYDRRFFSHSIQPNSYAIIGSSHLDRGCIEYFTNGRENLIRDINTLIDEMFDAKEYGSILKTSRVDFEALYARFEEIRVESTPSLFSHQVIEDLLPFVQCAEVMSEQYDIVITNPPYMNAAYMPEKLKDYIQVSFPSLKNDLFAVFADRVINMCKSNGQIGILMPYVWMFIASYQPLRKIVLEQTSISTIVQLEYNAFEAACVPVAALTMRKTKADLSSQCIRLSDFRGVDNQEPKTLEAVQHPDCGYRYTSYQRNYSRISGSPIAYWVDETLYKLFALKPLEKRIKYCEGLTTANNDLFLRLWFEIEKNKFSEKNPQGKWIPYNKGGEYRKWYGNRYFVVDWDENGMKIKNYPGSSFRNASYQLREGGTYSALTSGNMSVRYSPAGFAFDSKGTMLFANSRSELYKAIACMNAKLFQELLTIVSPTLDYRFGTIQKLPFLDVDCEDLVEENIRITKEDWDSFEMSWDFMVHPLIRKTKLISEAFKQWNDECESRFAQIKRNEEELNRRFLRFAGLDDTQNYGVDDSEITIRKADVKRDVISLISYAVGCMFGRYSLDVPGLVYAGGDWDASLYKSYEADRDGIIPICDDEYFEDDIVGRFVNFIVTVYGKETLEENLMFISKALGGKGAPREVIRSYFINDFFSDHCSTYAVTGAGKRPIYWLFDSGKKNGFKCLIYMHRYQPDTIARIRTDYVHEQQSRYRTAIADLEQRINGASTSERVKLSKQLANITAQAEEIRVYEEKVHHLADQMIKIDMDEGFKVNYAKFKDIVAKVK